MVRIQIRRRPSTNSPALRTPGTILVVSRCLARTISPKYRAMRASMGEHGLTARLPTPIFLICVDWEA